MLKFKVYGIYFKKFEHDPGEEMTLHFFYLSWALASLNCQGDNSQLQKSLQFKGDSF
jgi:hypothetical protein